MLLAERGGEILLTQFRKAFNQFTLHICDILSWYTFFKQTYFTGADECLDKKELQIFFSLTH
jgi:hypothetical protein